MKISFLVLVALCLTVAVSAKRTERRENKTYKNEDGLDVQVDKVIAETENSNVQTYQEGDAIIEEETKTIRTSMEAKRKGRRKKEKWVEAEKKACSEVLAAEAAECVGACSENQDCNFVIESEETCAWNCNCVQKFVEVVEEVIESESEIEGGIGEKRRRKVKKEGSGGKRKKVAAEGGKECSGRKKLSFSNCLLKLQGLVYWGDDAKDADSDFARLTGR